MNVKDIIYIDIIFLDLNIKNKKLQSNQGALYIYIFSLSCKGVVVDGLPF